jgi:hypothetical protein
MEADDSVGEAEALESAPVKLNRQLAILG